MKLSAPWNSRVVHHFVCIGDSCIIFSPTTTWFNILTIVLILSPMWLHHDPIIQSLTLKLVTGNTDVQYVVWCWSRKVASILRTYCSLAKFKGWKKGEFAERSHWSIIWSNSAEFSVPPVAAGVILAPSYYYLRQTHCSFLVLLFWN